MVSYEDLAENLKYIKQQNDNSKNWAEYPSYLHEYSQGLSQIRLEKTWDSFGLGVCSKVKLRVGQRTRFAKQPFIVTVELENLKHIIYGIEVDLHIKEAENGGKSEALFSLTDMHPTGNHILQK